MVSRSGQVVARTTIARLLRLCTSSCRRRPRSCPVGVLGDVDPACTAESRCPARPGRERSRARFRAASRATDALRLPVTGSSVVEPSLGKNARSSERDLAVRVGSDDAEVEVDVAGLEVQHGLRRPRAARRASPGRCRPTRRRRSRRARSCSTSAACWISASVAGPERISGGAANARPFGVRRTVIEPGPALLDDLVLVGARLLEPRVAGAERGMPRERELLPEREDPDAVVGALGREHERRLAQVRPVRERVASARC